jgi:pSer/pThr/pTyr-binding forkhead associated (FHA) protein
LQRSLQKGKSDFTDLAGSATGAPQVGQGTVTRPKILRARSFALPRAGRYDPPMSSGVIVQEQHKGKAHVCPTWSAVTVGREGTCQFLLKSETISRKHCELYAELDGKLKVVDLSSQGTFINGQRIDKEGVAKIGDELRLGAEVRLKVIGVLDPLLPKRDQQGLLTLPQRLLPHLVILNVVGHGGAGIVYEGYDEKRRRRVAVKVLIAGGRATPELLERFKREAMLQGSLKDYPGIVRVHELGTLPDSGELFFSMEFVKGGTLRQRVKDGLSHLEGSRLMARIARAVHYAHEHGIVHRDLKPGNIMVSEEDTIRLTDFGVCKALEDTQSLTLTGVMMGTPNYMAPEQVEDAKRVGPPADVYGLGAICYHVLTGQPPFLGDDLNRMLDLVVKGEFPPPHQLDPRIDAELSGVVMRAMVTDPDRRTPTAMKLAEELEAWVKRIDPPKKVTLKLPPKSSASNSTV